MKTFTDYKSRYQSSIIRTSQGVRPKGGDVIPTTLVRYTGGYIDMESHEEIGENGHAIRVNKWTTGCTRSEFEAMTDSDATEHIRCNLGGTDKMLREILAAAKGHVTIVKKTKGEIILSHEITILAAPQWDTNKKEYVGQWLVNVREHE